MPESPVQNLPLATTIKDRDRTVLEQDNEAKGMMMQDLIRYLFTASDKGGVWGIHVGSSQPAGTQNLWIDTSTSPVTLKIRDTKYPDIWTSVPVISQPTTQDDFKRWNLDINHPIGSWWWSDSPTNPAIILGGGEWEIMSGRVLVGADGGRWKVGSTGGEEEHTLTISEMPSHKHETQNPKPIYAGTGNRYNVPVTDPKGASGPDATSYLWMPTKMEGGGKPHNNMPPYYCSYLWRRIA